MHILEIPSFFPPYGGLFCLEQSKALAGLGHEVRIIANVQLSIKRDIFAYVFKQKGYETIFMDGIEVSRHETRGIPKVVRPNVSNWVNTVLRMYKLYVSRYGTPDIIHAHCAKWAGYASYLISKEYGVPYVITEHLPSMIFKEEFGAAPANTWQIPLLKETYKSAGMVIPVSRELVDDIAPYFGCDYKYIPISNTIDTDFFSFRLRKPIDNRPFRFCCIADYIPRKGYDILFNAFDLLFNKCDEVVELYIAGTGTDTSKCMEEIRKHHSSDKIKALGHIDKYGVRDLLYSSDCLILPSRSEAQPLVILEALSTGIPVVSTECVPKSLRINEGCKIVPIDDYQALSEEMIKVLEWNNFDGKEISKKVADLASPAVVGRKIENVFMDVIGKSSV